MNKILLAYFPIGPTFRDRLIYFFEKFEFHNLFDILIVTDYVEYFDKYVNKYNLTVIDINELRKDDNWSFDYELIPDEKIDEGKFALEMRSRIKLKTRFPLTLHRYIFSLDLLDNYKGVVLFDCDSRPCDSKDHIDKWALYLDGLKESRITTFRPYQYNKERDLNEFNGQLLRFARELNKNLNLNCSVDYNFISTDGPMRVYNFYSKNDRLKFFNIFNEAVKLNFQNFQLTQ